MHPRNWKSSTSSAGTDLKLDLQHWWWRQHLVSAKGLWSTVDESDTTPIFISDSVSCEVSGTEAVAVAPKDLNGDLNAEDLDTPFLLI